MAKQSFKGITTPIKLEKRKNEISVADYKKMQPKISEAQLQISCVNWFQSEFPQYKRSLFHIPNGGSRNVIEAANLKKQGTQAGVADLFLMVASQGYNGFFIEMKVEKNKQTQSQLDFELECNKRNLKYRVIRSLDTFQVIVRNYLK